MNNKLIRVLKYLIGWPLSTVSLFFVFKLIYSNLNSLNNLRNINVPLLFIGIILFIVYFLLRTYLWKNLISGSGNKFSYLKTSYLWEMSEIKRYTPGNIWSFLSRAKLFSENNVTKKDVTKSLFNEVILIILSCFTISYFYASSFFHNHFISSLLLLSNIILILVYSLNGKLRIKFFPKESIELNFKFYIIAIFAFFIFGLATYFTAISVIYLNLYNVLSTVSLFVFALLVGYLSIIAPMGLGVREGVTTFGLSSQVSVADAGLIAIFTRIVFILSELIFLTIVSIFNNLKNKYYVQIKYFISLHKYETFLLISMFIFISYFTVAGFLRYDNFYTGRFDLGNMDQTVWNTIHGRIFQSTDANGTAIISRLAYHADFILVLISPLYLIWSNPKMLILLQTIIVAIGALFVYLISKDILKNKFISMIFSISYLLYPALSYNLLFDFHGVTLATTFLLATYYFFLKRKYVLFLFFAILSGICKEQVWSVIAIFGLAFVFRTYIESKFKNSRELIFGLLIFLISSFLFYVLIWKIIPYFRGGNHFALAYFSDFGNNTSEIFLNIFLNPVKTFSIILRNENLVYLSEIFFPLGFLSILGLPLIIFASPDFLINLLSNNPQLHQIYYQYTSVITPFIFISAIYGTKVLTKKFKFIRLNHVAIYLISLALVSQYYIGPLPGSLKPNIDMLIKPLTSASEIQKFISSIPTKYSIAATNNLGSHLSRRQNIYTIPLGVDKADVILFLINNGYSAQTPKEQNRTVEQMEKNKRYILIYKKDNFIVFEKRTLYEKPKPKKGQVNLFPYSIKALMDRDYRKSEITIEKQVNASGNFKSYRISFLVDGLKEYALLNIPDKRIPQNGFPVVVIDHGYIPPAQYNTVNSYKSESDYFANNGFLVIKPDYRGNGNSELDNQAFMRFEYPVDVLTLLSSLSNIQNADLNNVFLWSHSMGGEVTLTVLEVSSQNKSLSTLIKGAAFWAPVTDPVKWFSKSNLPRLEEATITPYPYTKTFQILGTPDQNPELWQSLSPLNYLSNIETPILLQHGTGDTTVPYGWSVELYKQLQFLNKSVQFISYPNDSHNLPLNWADAMSKDLEFFKSLQK